MLTGGTENHLLVLDVASTHGITGRQAEDAVRKCGITLNRNPIPFDPNGPWYTSGLRFGTAAVTTLGMDQAEMEEIAAVVALVLKNVKPATTKAGALDKTKYTTGRDGSQRGPGPGRCAPRFLSRLSRDRPAVLARPTGIEISSNGEGTPLEDRRAHPGDPPGLRDASAGPSRGRSLGSRAGKRPAAGQGDRRQNRGRHVVCPVP